jgi:NAD(P)H-hydrate repair Nnr-like enzyme with NAD(P)H-hydrate dehydratase domain
MINSTPDAAAAAVTLCATAAEIANRELGRSWRKEVLAEKILRFRFDEKFCELSGKLCK